LEKKAMDINDIIYVFTLARPVLSNGSEARTIRRTDVRRNAFPEEDCRIHPLGPQKK
jgi:hypothetical protein